MMVAAVTANAADKVEKNAWGNDPACFQLIGSEGAVQCSQLKNGMEITGSP